MLVQPRPRRLISKGPPRWRHLKVVASDWFDPSFMDRPDDLPAHFITLPDPEAALRDLYHEGYLFSDRYFDLFLQALRRGDKGALASWRTYVYGRRGSGFVPQTNTYSAGSSGTETAPTGATTCVITVDGGGGGGAKDANEDTGAGGGGGAARVIKTVSISGGDQVAYSAALAGSGKTGADGNGGTGGTSTVNTGTGGFSGVSLSAGGGGAGRTNAAGGTGGTASGGDTNTNGSNAAGQGGTPGVAYAGGAGGGGGAGGNAGGTTAGGGGGSYTAGSNGSLNGGNGAGGRITFDYT